MNLNVGKKYESVTVKTCMGDITIGDAYVLDRLDTFDGGQEPGYVLAVSPVAVAESMVISAVGERDYL